MRISLYFSLITGKFALERGSLQTASSAIESFSGYDSTKNDWNMRLGGQFRITCGNGEISDGSWQRRMAVPIQNLDPDVLMMQSAKDRNCRYGADR